MYICYQLIKVWSGAYEQERASPLLAYTCNGHGNGAFTDQVIFGIIIEHLFPRKWKHRSVCVRIHVTIITKLKKK